MLRAEPRETENRRGSQSKSNAREQFIIQRVAEGCKNREIADSLGTTEHVVKNYLRLIYDKLGLWNRVELALWYEARQHEQVYHA
jgi:DNA-binding NarL/FixJ family response regulator